MTYQKLNLSERKYRSNPYKEFSALREKGEVIQIKIPFLGKSWAATTYQSVNEVLKNTDRFARDPMTAGRKSLVPMQWILPRSFFRVANNMLGADGEKHRRLRMLVDRAFALRNIEAMTDQIQVIANEQLDQFSNVINQNGKADLIESFARPFPLTVICELLGLPLEDRPKFKKWFSPISNVNSIFGIFKFGFSARKIANYLQDEFEKARHNPKPGLISNLVKTELEGDQLNDEELLSMVFLLLLAGHETTVHLISNMLLTLMQNPDARCELVSDWSLCNSAIDEVMRFCSPIQLAKPRYVINDMNFHGRSLKRGELITALLACANYDPARFEKPMEFNMHRKQNYHMTFGSGPHVCLGMKLAKSETSIAVKSLFDRFPRLQPEFDLENPDWNSRIGVRGLNSLWVRPS